MALVGDTGQGWTFTAGTQTLSLAIKSIDCGKWARGALDVSTLATTAFMEKIMSDLVDAGTVTIEFVFKTSATAPSVSAVAETFTITAAQQTGDTAAATLVGTGFGTEITWPTAANGQVLTGKYTITWDGDTGPTYTKATTS